jgi:bis(5'-nucleosyl)-tetraphosphatase (symmetrical)
MSTYAIGDLQGCYDELQRLLDQIQFDPPQDRLWFVGDLVNRGPASLACLRFIQSLGEHAVAVLGNHDLHLLAVAEGCAKVHRGDTLEGILRAPDRDTMLHWLRFCPLLHRGQGHLLVHAGLLPVWSADKAAALALEVEEELRGPKYREFMAAMYGNWPDSWHDGLVGYDRLRVIINAMTRLRFCTPEGRMDFVTKGEAATARPGYLPWFDVPGRASSDTTIVCGHWASLGLRLTPNLIATDTGCVWGGSLTAVRLEDRALFQLDCGSPPRIAG